MLSRDKIEHITKLTKINFLPKEKEKFFKEFSQILNFVGKLNEIDVSGIEPFVFDEIVGTVREDLAARQNDNLVNKLMSNVPEKSGRLVKVKKIFK